MSFFLGKVKALALAYDSEQMDAPIVSAIGSDELAKEMLKQAKRSGVPIVRSDKMVKSMRDCEVCQTVPEVTYPDLAKIFSKYSIR